MEYASETRGRFLVWVCLMLFTEGGHFTLIPNVLKALFGETATQIYALIFTFTGLSALFMIGIVRSDFGHNYEQVFKLSSMMSIIALVLLVVVFDEKRQMVQDKPEGW